MQPLLSNHTRAIFAGIAGIQLAATVRGQLLKTLRTVLRIRFINANVGLGPNCTFNYTWISCRDMFSYLLQYQK